MILKIKSFFFLPTYPNFLGGQETGILIFFWPYTVKRQQLLFSSKYDGVYFSLAYELQYQYKKSE